MDFNKMNEIRDFAIGVMQVPKGRREHIGQIVDIALNLLAKNIDPKLLTVVRSKKELGDDCEGVFGSPFMDDRDHVHILLKARSHSE